MQFLPHQTYALFASFLNARIDSRQHLTEDSVRYAFFLAVLQTTAIKQHEMMLELPHPKFPGKKVDTYIAPAEGRPEAFLEFKFHRASKSTSPKPQKAGALFKDISRMASLASSNRSCVVIYLTCAEMAKYFTANETDYSMFWRTEGGADFVYDDAFLAKTTATFRKASGEHHYSRVHVEYSESLAHGHHLRVLNAREA